MFRGLVMNVQSLHNETGCNICGFLFLVFENLILSRLLDQKKLKNNFDKHQKKNNKVGKSMYIDLQSRQ